MPRHRSRRVLLVLFTADMVVTIVKSLSNQIANMSDAMSAENDIDIIKIGKKALSVTLSNAATNGNHALTGRRSGKTFAR